MRAAPARRARGGYGPRRSRTRPCRPGPSESGPAGRWASTPGRERRAVAGGAGDDGKATATSPEHGGRRGARSWRRRPAGRLGGRGGPNGRSASFPHPVSTTPTTDQGTARPHQGRAQVPRAVVAAGRRSAVVTGPDVKPDGGNRVLRPAAGIRMRRRPRRDAAALTRSNGGRGCPTWVSLSGLRTMRMVTPGRRPPRRRHQVDRSVEGHHRTRRRRSPMPGGRRGGRHSGGSG